MAGSADCVDPGQTDSGVGGSFTSVPAAIDPEWKHQLDLLHKAPAVRGLEPSKEISDVLLDLQGTDLIAAVYVLCSENPYRGTVDAVGNETVALHSVNPIGSDFPGHFVTYVRLDLIVSVEHSKAG